MPVKMFYLFVMMISVAYFAGALKLSEGKKIILAQTVGYPATRN